MSGPWEKYKQGPWSAYQGQPVVEEPRATAASQNRGALADIATAFKQGAVGATKALTDFAGADNQASQYLSGVLEAQQGEYSPARQAELQRQAERLEKAEASGSMLEEAKARAADVLEAPVSTAASAVGSVVPVVGSILAAKVLGPAAAALGLGARTVAVLNTVLTKIVPRSLGTAQGLGAAKGSIYDGVYRAEVESGTAPELAQQKARAAQEYLGENLDQILLGGGLGYLAGSSGVEKLLTPGVARSAKLLPRIAGAALPETLTEGAQGGQERLAQNIALQREGFAVPTMQGVAGAATGEGLAGLLGAGAIGAVTGPKPARQEQPTEDEQAELEAQRAREAARLEPKEAPTEPPAEATYAELVQARERLRQEEQTPETKAATKALDERIRLLTLPEAERAVAQVEQTKRGEELAKQSAFAAQEPQQMEFGGMGEPAVLPDAVRAAGPEVEGWAKTDAGQAFVRQVVALPETEVEAMRESLPKQGMEARLQRKAFDALYPPATKATPQELEAAGQQRLPLRRTPTGQPTTSALEELDAFGTVTAPPADADIPEPTLRKKPELIQHPELTEETVGKTTMNWVKTKKGQEFLRSIIDLDPAEAQARRKEFVGRRQLVRGEIFDAIYPEQAPTPAGANVRPEPTAGQPTAEPSVGVPPPSGPDQTGAELAEPSDGAGVGDLSGPVGTKPVAQGAPAPAVAPQPLAIDQLLRGATTTEPTSDVEPEADVAPEPAPVAKRPSAFDIPKRSLFDPIREAQEARDEVGGVIYKGDAYRTPEPQAAPAKPIADADLRKIVGQVTRSLDLPDGAGVMVMDSVTQVDPKQAPGSRAGALIDGQVYLFRDGIPDGVEGQKTVFHELFHKGLRNLLPPAEYFRTMQSLYRQSAEVRKQADAWLADAQNAADVKKYSPAERQAIAVDEILAGMAEQRKLPTTIRQLGNWLAKIADRLGLKELARSIRTMGMKPLEAFVDDALRAAGGRGADKGVRYSTPKTDADKGKEVTRVVRALGNEPAPDPTAKQKLAAIYDDVRHNPREVVTESTGTLRKWWNTFGNNVWSSDFEFQANMRRALERRKLPMPQIMDFLLRTSTAQASNADALATSAMVNGALKIDGNLIKAVKSDNNMPALAQSFKRVAEKYGLTTLQTEQAWHTVTEAERLRRILKDEARLTAEADRFEAEGDPAAAAKRRELIKKAHRNPQQIAEGLRIYDLMPELRESTKIWNAFKGNIVDFMADTGVMDRKMAEEYIDDATYVPFYRVEQIDNNKGPREYMTGLMVRKDPKFKGSYDKPVNDVFDNVLRWAQYSVEKSVRNHRALTMVKTMQELGWARPVSTLPRELQANPPGEVVKVFEDGKQVAYQTDIPGALSAFSGLESVSIPALKYFSKIADVLRQSVVLNPVFAVLQVPQDSFAAMFTSGLKPRYALTVPARAVKEFTKTLFNMSKTHKDLKKYGAVGRRDVTSAVRRNDFEAAMGLKPNPGIWGRVTDKLHHISMASDSAVRQAVYEASIAQGLSKGEAIQKAFDLINFRYRGNSKLMSLAAQTIPFFNAYSAATYVAYKTLTGQGISPTARSEAWRVYTQMFAVTAALSLIYAMLIGDDEDYQKTGARERDRSLMIPGTGIGIPLRPDVFLLPKVLAEHTYQMMLEDGTTDPAKMRKSITEALVNTVASPTTVPQAVKPLAEVMLNYNFFTGRPIVGTFEQDKAAMLQYNEYTSELSKALSAGLGTDVVAPAKLDHLIRGTLGSFGAGLMWFTNLIMDPEVGGEKADISWRDVAATFPGMGAVVRNTNEAGLVSDFYELREITRKAHNTYLQFEANMPEMLDRYVEDPKSEARLELADDVEDVGQALTEIRQAKQAIRMDPDMSGEEKETALRELDEARNEILQSVPLKEWRTKALNVWRTQSI